MDHPVRASKVTGTASLKDILNMQDAGAESVSDFSHLGFPSTYMLEEQTLVSIFENLDARYAASPGKHWVVEFADGVMQRETALLLRNEYVRSRIHRLIFSANDAFGTVGAMALDRRGNVAAATSTGGLVNQLAGRVGDTPIIGSGTLADNAVCAISATGKGDAFARVAFARRVADLIGLSGADPQSAATSALEEVARVKGEGGCLLLTPDGELVMPFTTPRMVRGWATNRNAPTVALLRMNRLL